jgi:uncharacterized membrane protein YgcG
LQREKLIVLHQSQIQEYHKAAKKALMEWATNVSLPEINNTIHDTQTSYIKSCRAVTIATRPIWRELSTSSTSTKKELPVNEMAMNIIEERAKMAFEKLQQQTTASYHTTTTSTMENIPEEDGEDEDGEIDEGDNMEGDVVVESTEEDNKDEVNNDPADNSEDRVMKNEDVTNEQHDTTTANTGVKANLVTSKSSIPEKKNMISLLRKNKPNQTQMPPPPPSKRSNTTTNTKLAPLKKTNITKPINATVQQHRNNQAMNNRGSGGGSGRGGSNASSGRSGGGRGGGGATRNGGVTSK